MRGKMRNKNRGSTVVKPEEENVVISGCLDCWKTHLISIIMFIMKSVIQVITKLLTLGELLEGRMPQ